MHKIKLFIFIIASFILVSCGGGGGGSSSSTDKVKVNLNIDSDAFDQGRRIPFNGKFIESIKLKVTAAEFATIDQEISDEVENSESISLTLDAEKTYLFEISALDLDSVALCYGSDSVFITKNTTTNVELICTNESNEPVILAGIAASGLPISGKAFIKDSTGTIKSVDLSDSGYFSFDVSDMTPPYILRAEGTVGDSDIELYSVSSGDDTTININPYTNLALSIAVGDGDLESLYENPSSASDKLTRDNLSGAIGTMQVMFSTLFSAMGITDFDPINGSYAADGQGVDGILDNLDIRVGSNGSVNIVNINTNESVVSGNVSSLSGLTIPGAVATEVATYVSDGSVVFDELKSFINDFYFERSRTNLASYYDSDGGWLDGAALSYIVSSGSFPESSYYSSIEDFAIAKRTSTDEVVLYYIENYKSGERIPKKLWLKKKDDGKWYITGNERKIYHSVKNYAIRNVSQSSVEYRTGVQFLFKDGHGHGIDQIIVEGPGLPDGGLDLRGFGTEFEIFDPQSEVNNSSMKIYMNESQVAEANDSFINNGFIEYDITAYKNEAEYDSQVARIFTPIKTIKELEASPELFVSVSSAPDFDLEKVLTALPIELTTNASDIDNFAFGTAGFQCDLYNGGDYTAGELLFHTGELTVTMEPDISHPEMAETCDAYLSYYDEQFREYVTELVMERTFAEADLDVAKAAADQLTADDIKGNNTSVSDITSDLSLPFEVGDVLIEWYSSEMLIISNEGMFYGEPLVDTTVILKGVFMYKDAKYTKEFEFIVKAGEFSDIEIVQANAYALTFDAIKAGNSMSEFIFSNLFLPTSGSAGAEISWASSNTDVISNAGVVTLPPSLGGPVDVTLTATVTYGNASETVEFMLSVIAASPTTDDAIVLNDIENLNEEDIMGNNFDRNQIIFDLELPLSAEHGSALSWVSSDSRYIDNNGNIVSRPTVSEGMQAVTLTATFTKNDSSATRAYTLTVPAAVPEYFVAGIDVTAVIDSSGELYNWGRNQFGQLAQGSTTATEYSPLQENTSSNWLIVSGSGSFRSALKNDGTIWSWGYNNHGQLGDESVDPSSVPIKELNEDEDWIAVSSAEEFTVGLKADGTIWSWGYNGFGQLGKGDFVDSFEPVQESTASKDWAYVKATKSSVFAIKTDGTLWSWGGNNYGKLGQGSSVPVENPTQVGIDDDWIAVEGGSNHTVGLKSDGTVWCAGYNNSGQLGNSSNTNSSTFVQETTYSLSWKAIGAGEDVSFGIREDGTLWSWGNNANAQLGVGDTDNRNSPTQEITGGTDWVDVDSSYSHTLAMNSDGNIFGWGAHTYGVLNLGADVLDSQNTSPLRNYIYQLSSYSNGEFHSSIINSSGELWSWGVNTDGGLGDGSTTGKSIPVKENTSSTDWTKVVSGRLFTVAIQSDGTLWAWGENVQGQLGDGSTSDSNVPIKVNSDTDWKDVAVGDYHTLALKADGTLYAWGKNDDGQLGDNTTTKKTSPVAILSSKTDWVKIYAQGDFSAGIDSDGDLWLWGQNASSQLGDGLTVDLKVPTLLASGSGKWVDAALGDDFVVALQNDGTLWGWGDNSQGQFGDGSTTSSSTPKSVAGGYVWAKVYAGNSHTIAIDEKGELYGWGVNSSDQLGDGTGSDQTSPVKEKTGSTSWVDASVGGDSVLARRSDGSLWAWGDNTDYKSISGYVTYPVEIYSR